jgi:hypothetical protein
VKLEGTVLDGELISTTQNDLPTRLYAVFDIYALSGNMLAYLSQDRETTVSRRRRRLDMLKTTTPHRHDEAGS